MSFYRPAVVTLALAVVFCSVSLTSAQEKENPFANNILGTLANKQMAAELDLLDQQQENINQLLKEFGRIRHEVGQDMKAQWEAASDAEREEIGKQYWQRVEEGRLIIAEQMKAELLPHQIDRLEQLSAQRMMLEGKGRESAGLLGDQMIEYLNIGPEQKKRIEAKSNKLKKEVSEKIRKILEQAKEDLLAELDTTQKAKYEKLVGDPVAEQSDFADPRKESRKPGKGKRK